MNASLAELLPILVLIVLGAILGRVGFFGQATIDGFKRFIASVSLPVLLFTAFSRLSVQGALFALAGTVFASCAVLGLVGIGLSRLLRLPRPSTGLLFQGFEAGMLGYALFTSFFGAAQVPAFATADLGQVVFVFTVLMAQLLAGERGGRLPPLALVKNFVSSPVILAIVAGLVSSVFVPGAKGLSWGSGGVLDPTLHLVGGVTTPLVGLVVGFGLKDGIKGAASCFLTVFLRLAATAALGALVAFVVVPALGLGRLSSTAVMMLFLLPPPFVIPVFRTRPEDGAFISGTLSIHTVASLAAIVGFVVFSS